VGVEVGEGEGAGEGEVGRAEEQKSVEERNEREERERGTRERNERGGGAVVWREGEREDRLLTDSCPCLWGFVVLRLAGRYGGSAPCAAPRWSAAAVPPRQLASG
jgi:hypothetical protein